MLCWHHTFLCKETHASAYEPFCRAYIRGGCQTSPHIYTVYAQLRYLSIWGNINSAILNVDQVHSVYSAGSLSA